MSKERCSSAEEMDSDDLGGDLNLSDSDGGVQERVMRKKFKKERRQAANESVNVYRQEFDTNVFEVKLDCLNEKG